MWCRQVALALRSEHSAIRQVGQRGTARPPAPTAPTARPPWRPPAAPRQIHILKQTTHILTLAAGLSQNLSVLPSMNVKCSLYWRRIHSVAYNHMLVVYSCLFSTVFFYMASYRVFKLIIRIVNEYFEHWYKVNLATQAKHRHYRNAIFEHHVSDWLNRLTVALAYLFRINFTQILFALCLVQSLVCKQHLEQSFGIVRCYHRFQTTGVPHKLRNNISDTALLSLSKQNKKNIAVFLNNL